MALKRKRSSTTISSPASIASDATTKSASPPPFSYQQNRPIELSHKPTWSFPTYDDQPQQHLNSRTRKRYRNNRPDEQSVYASTISKLYAAQKQLTNASPVYSTLTSTPPPESVELPPQRTTLHSFWRIPQPPPPATSMEMDCSNDMDMSGDAPYENDDSSREDSAMDVDESFANQDAMCQSCQGWIRNRYTVMGNLRVCRTCADSGYR